MRTKEGPMKDQAGHYQTQAQKKQKRLLASPTAHSQLLPRHSTPLPSPAAHSSPPTPSGTPTSLNCLFTPTLPTSSRASASMTVSIPTSAPACTTTNPSAFPTPLSPATSNSSPSTSTTPTKATPD